MASLKRTMALTLAVGTVVTGLIGCGEAKKTEAQPAVEDTTPITIQYWHSHAENQMEGLNYMIAEFNKKYPYITVEPVFQGAYADLHKKLQAAVVANDVPAVTNVEVSSLPNFAEGGVFMDLTDWIERDKLPTEDFAEGMLNAYAYEGRQFGLPLIVSTSVFIYNKTLLDSLGVQPPQKWDDIEEFNKKVTVSEGGKTTRYAFSVPGWDPWYYDPWILNGGGSILTEDNKSSAVETPESLRYIKLFEKWKKDGSMHIGYGKGASDTMRQMFLDEKIAMVEHSSAIIKTYVENANFEVGVSFLPGDKQRTSNIGGAGIVIMNGAKEKEKEAAWNFVQFMTSAEHNIKWAEYVGYLPTRKSSLQTEEAKEYSQRWPQYKAVFDNFDNVTPRLQHPAYPEFRNFYMEVVGELALNDKDPEPLMKEAAKKINDVLKEYE